MRHTPGPWRIPAANECCDALAASLIVCNQAGSSLAECASGDPFISVPECQANARLIAAAPELLEACEQALAIEESVTQTQESQLRTGFVEALRAAIAKAKGADLRAGKR